MAEAGPGGGELPDRRREIDDAPGLGRGHDRIGEIELGLVDAARWPAPAPPSALARWAFNAATCRSAVVSAALAVFTAACCWRSAEEYCWAFCTVPAPRWASSS